MSSVLKMLDIENRLVSISRFNKGEANKIFEEVREAGQKIVVKNNQAACVLLSPEMYAQLREQLEDYALYLEAESRMQTEPGTISHEDLLQSLGITQEELDACPVEFEGK